jgi:hypothetical protein
VGAGAHHRSVLDHPGLAPLARHRHQLIDPQELLWRGGTVPVSG